MKNKIIALIIVISIIVASLSQFTFADEFWDLYQFGEAKYNSGDVKGAIEQWLKIVNMYQNDSTNEGLTRSAVYWTKIANAYYEMEWLGEAQEAYKKVEHFWNRLGETESALGPNRNASRLKTELDVYAKVPIDNNKNMGKFEPQSGIYFGAPFDKDSQIGNALGRVSEVYGKKHTSFLMYVAWGHPIQYGIVDMAKELDTALQISWEPPSDMSKITYNDVKNFATELKNIGIPIFLRFACEMNETSSAWANNFPKLYKEKFRLVSETMHSIAPNVAIVWSPNYVPVETINDYYPGDDVVDWVGINGYTNRYFIGDKNASQLVQDIYYQGYYANPTDRLDYIYNTYSERKPIMISETGVDNFSFTTGEDLSKWGANNLRKLYSYLPLKYPRIKAIYYFNVDSNLALNLKLKQNYGLSVSSEVMNAYKEVIRNPYYLSNVGDNAGFQYKPLQQIKINKNKEIEIASYVKLTDPFINKLEYWIDGKKISTVEIIPFNQTLDLSNLTEGKHILKIDAFDSKNQLSARRTYVINIYGNNCSFEAKNVQYIPRHVILYDIDSHWAKDQIEKLISLWSVEGYGDGRFSPEKQITRAEFYKLLSTSLGMELQVNTNQFVDVEYNHWAKELLDGGVELGIIDKKEYGDRFGADKPITRGELAKMAVRAINGGQDVNFVNTDFADNNQIEEKYRGYIKTANQIGIIDGFDDNTFKANETATRAQAVSMMVRLVEYVNNN